MRWFCHVARSHSITALDRGIDLVDISSATNIAGSKFDSHKNAVAPKGKLDKSVTAAKYTSFISLLDSTELGRFGLHNGTNRAGCARRFAHLEYHAAGDPDDNTLIDAKWESIALAPVGDSANPHDYFLFTAVSTRIYYSIRTLTCAIVR